MTNSRSPSPLRVSFSGFSGEAHYDNASQVLSVVRTAGANADVATFELVDPDREKFQDVGVAGFFTDSEVLIVAEQDEPIFWGRITGTSLYMQGSRLLVTAKLDDALYGEPLIDVEVVTKPKDWVDSADEITTFGPEPLIFNPVIDGYPVGNMLLKTAPADAPGYVDPGSVPLSTLSDGGYERWTLPRAVQYLYRLMCSGLIGQQSQIELPPLVDLTNVLGDNTSLLQNFEIPLGVTFPQALDRLLKPFGFRFIVDLSRDLRLAAADGAIRKMISISPRGKAEQVELKLQRFGESLDWEKSEVADFEIDVDFGGYSTTDVEVIGSRRIVEKTWDLMPAWDPAHDAVADDALMLTEDGVTANPAYNRVWRDWVLNENNEYTSLRADNTDNSLPTLECFVRRRRRFLPTVSVLPNGDPVGLYDGVRIEYWNGEEWKNITTIGDPSVVVLQNECGVRFADVDKPPAFLRNMGVTGDAVNAKVRVTASLEEDNRCRERATTVPRFTLFSDRVAVKDMRRSLHIRTKDAGSSIAGGADRVIDESPKATVIAAQALDAWRDAVISGKITIEGFDRDNSRILGKAIVSIQDRNIVFNQSPDPANPRYPEVVAIEYDGQKHMTYLHLESMRG